MIAARDLRRLHWHLTGALAMAIAGAVTFLSVHDDRTLNEQRHREAAGRLEAIGERYRRAMADEADMHALLARYDDLRTDGTVGPERRLEWIEGLRRIRDGLGLPALRYELRPQRSLSTAGGPGPRLMASGMTLDLALRHEGELVAVFDALSRERSAIVVPRGCTIDRLPRDSGTEGANLRANCEVDWVTIQHPAASSARSAK